MFSICIKDFETHIKRPAKMILYEESEFDMAGKILITDKWQVYRIYGNIANTQSTFKDIETVFIQNNPNEIRFWIERDKYFPALNSWSVMSEEELLDWINKEYKVRFENCIQFRYGLIFPPDIPYQLLKFLLNIDKTMKGI